MAIRRTILQAIDPDAFAEGRAIATILGQRARMTADPQMRSMGWALVQDVQ